VCVSPLKSQNQSQNHQAEFNGVIDSSDIKHDNNPGSGYDGKDSKQDNFKGYVSFSQLPSRAESGSAVQKLQLQLQL
jgi:hypothetical protein